VSKVANLGKKGKGKGKKGPSDAERELNEYVDNLPEEEF